MPDGQDGVLIFTTLTKEAMPLLRYWTGDITSLTREPGMTGRTHVRMGPIKGRADDMLIIRGVNLYPTQIEEVLGGIEEVVPHYQLVVRREGTLDEVALNLELSESVFQAIGVEKLSEDLVEAHDLLRQIKGTVQHKIKDTLGLTVQVSLLAPGKAPRSTGGKLSRVVDERTL